MQCHLQAVWTRQATGQRKGRLRYINLDQSTPACVADASGTLPIVPERARFTGNPSPCCTTATQLTIAYDTAVTTTTTATTTTEPASDTATAPTAPVITVAEVPAVGLSKVQRSDGRSVRSTIEATTSDAASTITIRNDDATEFTVVHEPTLLRANFTVYRGTTLAISGDGYEPNTDIDIWLNSSPTLLGSATTTETGTFTFDVVVPLDFELGDHVLQVEGTVDSDVDQATFIGLTVLDRSAVELPATGSNWSGALAAWMIAVGAVLALVSSRRRPGTSRGSI